MSATQSWYGPFAVKFLFSKSGGLQVYGALPMMKPPRLEQRVTRFGELALAQPFFRAAYTVP